MRKTLTGPAGTLADEDVHAREIDLGQVFGRDEFKEPGDGCQI